MMRKPWTYFASTSGPEFKKVLVAASLLATIPVLIMGLIAYIVASDKIVDEISVANRQTILQIQQRIDEKLVTLEKVTLQNALNPTLSRFLSMPEPQKDIENFGLTLSLLNSMQVLIEDVDSVNLSLNRDITPIEMH